MSQYELIEIHHSPWSERVRWAFEFKGLAYARRPYDPMTGEADLKAMTGQTSVPVLVTYYGPIADSTAILDWLEASHGEPALMPEDPVEHGQVVLWEEVMARVFGPAGRDILTRNLIASGNEQLAGVGTFLETKYGCTDYAGRRASATCTRILESLLAHLKGRDYLVGDRFTRADLTAAALLTAANPPSEEVFKFSEQFAFLRPFFDVPAAREPRFAPVLAWRDAIYANHRGGPVLP